MTEKIVDNYLDCLTLHLSDDYAIESHILDNGIWETHLVSLFQYFVKQGFNCVDAGANTGIHTLTMASLVGESGKVIAYEPSPEYSERIERNLKLNPGLAGRIEVHRKGLSDKSGTLKLFESGDKPGNAYMAEECDSTLWNRFAPDVYTECPVTRLDDELANVRVDLIKIDVEGMEARVFKGAQNIIKRDKPILIYETLVKDFGEKRTKAMSDLVNCEGYFQYFTNQKMKKLARCFFPYLPEDVIAIHPSRLLAATPIILNCVRYQLDDAACLERFAGEMFLTVVQVNPEQYAICLSTPGDDSPAMILTYQKKNGVLTFEQEWKGLHLHVSSEVINTGTTPWEAKPEILLTIEEGGICCDFRAKLLGGTLI